jgi:nitrogen regulatory protein P-II 1
VQIASLDQFLGIRVDFETLNRPLTLHLHPMLPIFCTGSMQDGPAHQKRDPEVKLIIATIKPFKLEDVREALTEAGVRGLMVTEIKGFGAQSGHTEIYRGAEYVVNFVPKIKLELVVADNQADQLVDVISKTAKTGKIGDGKVFVLDVQQALRVRTGETGEDAI